MGLFRGSHLFLDPPRGLGRPLIWAPRPFRGVLGTLRVHVGYIVGTKGSQG